MNDNQKQLGKYYTINNPFDLNVFKDWFNHIPNVQELTILEPFAGSNNIVNLMGVDNNWECYDILPTTNLAPKFKIKKRDTIKNFPKGFEVAITNPPYLAKNSATRNSLVYQGEPYDDLYKKCLEVMLDCVPYVAAIIPESFITAGIFQERLDAVISLTCKMFDDTDCPVCLALFSKDKSEDFHVFRMDEFLGSYNKDLIWYKPISIGKYKWKFNDPLGEIGIYCIDNTKEMSIKFIPGKEIDSSKIKISSRSLTRVSVSGIKIKNLNFLLQKCNDYLMWYRSNTKDVFLTTFKGLRSDGLYRRRLDFDTARAILDTVIEHFGQKII